MMLMQKIRHGFTAVELVIVITVIGIVSAIVVISYQGAQERAREAMVATSVRSYADAISSYRVSHGYWPPASSRSTGLTACLGSSNSYATTYGNLTPGVCSTISGTTVSNDFNTEITPYLNNPADLSFMQPLKYNPTSKYGRGIYYSLTCLINYCDFSATPIIKLDVRINYVIPSTKSCVIGKPLADTPITGFTTCSYIIQEGATS